jgi:hypothetical protein
VERGFILHIFITFCAHQKTNGLSWDKCCIMYIFCMIHMFYWNVIKNYLNMKTVNTAGMLFSHILYFKKYSLQGNTPEIKLWKYIFHFVHIKSSVFVALFCCSFHQFQLTRFI